jgi:type 1 glutamine amidotransferase
MWNRGRVLVALASLLAILPAGASGSRVSVLLLSGSNNHDWRSTTPVLAEILAGAGVVVQVEEHVAGLGPASLAGRDVVLSNFNVFGQRDPGPIWGPEMRAAFLRFIRAGGGFVGVHAGGSVFDDWPEFKRLAGGWWGPQTAHGAIHENAVTFFATGHPLTEGLDSFRTTDEFWQHTSLSPGAVVLAVVVPDPAHGGSGRPEPVLLATTMERGRGVGLLLGHDVRAMRNPGFERLLVRSVTWAATGLGAPSSTSASPANR